MQARQGKHSKQQCKRYRANTVTANSKASATRQAAQQPQPAPLSHPPCSARPPEGTAKHEDDGQSDAVGHKVIAPISTTSPLVPRRMPLVEMGVSGAAAQ